VSLQSPQGSACSHPKGQCALNPNGQPAITPRVSLQSPQGSPCNQPQGQPAITQRVSLQSPQGSVCTKPQGPACNHPKGQPAITPTLILPVCHVQSCHDALLAMGNKPCTGQRVWLSLAAHPMLPRSLKPRSKPVSLKATGSLESFRWTVIVMLLAQSNRVDIICQLKRHNII